MKFLCIMLLLIASSYASEYETDCYLGDRGYPDHLHVDDRTLDFSINGHRTSIWGKATRFSSPFLTQYTLTYGDTWIRLDLPNDNTKQPMVCFKESPCQPCR